MATLRRLLKHPEFSAILLFFCTTLFGWPFISIPGPAAMFVYLFTVWSAVIVLLCCMARAHGDPNRDRHKREHGG